MPPNLYPTLPHLSSLLTPPPHPPTNQANSQQYPPHPTAAGDYTLQVCVTMTTASTADVAMTGWQADNQKVFYLEAQEIETDHNHVAIGNGAFNGMSDPLPDRNITFTKKEDSTPLRIVYYDNMRNAGASGTVCGWEVLIDGLSCPSGDIALDNHQGAVDNDHEPHMIIGLCTGVNAGSHTITTRTYSVGSWVTGTCYTGWSNSDAEAQTWILEVDERPPVDTFFHALNDYNVDGKDSGEVTNRALPFTKVHTPDTNTRECPSLTPNLRLITPTHRQTYLSALADLAFTSHSRRSMPTAAFASLTMTTCGSQLPARLASGT